jgi:hypothetical protein
MGIGLIIIATGKYDRFIEPLLQSARIHFLPEDKTTFFLFTDSTKDYGDDVVVIPTEHKPWPSPTLHRYRNIVAAKDKFDGMDYLWYIDADSLFVDTVSNEVLRPGITGVLHPGFAMFPGKGSWGSQTYSMSFTPHFKRKSYYCGGSQFGDRDAYLTMCELMDYWIRHDEMHGIMPEFHDETIWNKLLSEFGHHVLDPSYCMVEQPELRKLWKIDHLKPKLLALSKNHQEVRS